MKLALISNHNTSQGKAALKTILSSLKINRPTVGYIASEPDPQRVFFKQTLSIYNELDAELSEYIELEEEFDSQQLQRLFTCTAIHLSGGDTFRFLKWLNYRKLRPLLADYVKSGGVLIGISAGAMLITPSIESAYLCGDINSAELADTTGLNLVPFQFVPHVSRQACDLDLMAKNAATLNADVYLCSDADSILLIDDQLCLIGQPLLVRNEQRAGQRQA